MARKPGSMYRYIRGQSTTRKKYMGGIPNPRITQFVMGNKTDDFPLQAILTARFSCHLLHHNFFLVEKSK